MTSKEKKDTCILVVDDEQEMREMISEYLDGEGYSVLSAENGVDALQRQFAARPIDLVLSDINMPMMKGFELLRQVREKYPLTKRVLITAYNVEDYLDLAMKYDIGNIFVKSTPFNFLELSTILANLLTNDIFGASNYFEKPPQVQKSFLIKRGDNLDANANMIISNIPHVATAKKVELVLIELLANAVFYGMRRESAEEKETWEYNFELADSEAIEVSLLADTEKFAISVMDRGGRLKKSDVLYWLNRQVSHDDAGVPLGLYDSHGRGFFIAREYIDRLIVNIDKNKMTEIIIINYMIDHARGYKPLYINEI
jgi:CheY-like chemotaxis protein